jgi:protein-tyrosine phosphatase
MDRRTLKDKNIRTVLTTASGLSVNYSGMNIVHRQWNMLDIESYFIGRYFEETYREIEEGLKRGSVLVHCAAGISRSASCVIAYLMKKYNMGFIQALNFTKKKRKFICPNYGFAK